jgi:hypothetical protein
MEMKTRYKWLGRTAAFFGLLGVMLVASNAANADSYNIFFKTARGGTPLPCATGGFTFTKTVAGTFPTTGASATFAPNCLPPATLNGTYTPGSLSVVVQDVTTTEPQGPNVVGLVGTLQYTTTAEGDCGAASTNVDPKTYTINFAANGTFQITCSGPGAYTPITYQYFVNNLNQAPEPETLWLALAGLSALALSRRKRRRS